MKMKKHLELLLGSPMKKNNILLFILFVIFHLDAFSHTQNIIIEKETVNTATMGIPVMQKC